MTIPKLEQWSVTSAVDEPWHPPEMERPYVVGRVFGDPQFEDGASIRVPLESVEGNRVQSPDGWEVELGVPNPAWVEWLTSIGITFNPDVPIRLVDKLNPARGPNFEGPT